MESSGAFPPRILDEVLKLPGNNKCCDCPSLDTDWGSVSHGTLLCLHCAGKHRALGVHISFVRSIYMDTWSPQQVEMMRQGGNAQIRDFFARLQIENSPITTLYSTKGATHYRNKLKERVEKVLSGEISSERKRQSHSPVTITPVKSKEIEKKIKIKETIVTQHIIFGPGSMGLTITKDYKGGAVVSKLVPDGAAQQKGVKLGDTIIGVAGKALIDFDEIMHMIPCMARPLQLTFTRVVNEEKTSSISLMSPSLPIAANSPGFVKPQITVDRAKLSPVTSNKNLPSPQNIKIKTPVSKTKIKANDSDDSDDDNTKIKKLKKNKKKTLQPKVEDNTEVNNNETITDKSAKNIDSVSNANVIQSSIEDNNNNNNNDNDGNDNNTNNKETVVKDEHEDVDRKNEEFPQKVDINENSVDNEKDIDKVIDKDEDNDDNNVNTAISNNNNNDDDDDDDSDIDDDEEEEDEEDDDDEDDDDDDDSNNDDTDRNENFQNVHEESTVVNISSENNSIIQESKVDNNNNSNSNNEDVDGNEVNDEDEQGDDDEVNEEEDEEEEYFYLVPGTAVKVLKKGKWRSAIIKREHKDGTYKVGYKDNTTESHVSVDRLAITRKTLQRSDSTIMLEAVAEEIFSSPNLSHNASMVDLREDEEEEDGEVVCQVFDDENEDFIVRGSDSLDAWMEEDNPSDLNLDKLKLNKVSKDEIKSPNSITNDRSYNPEKLQNNTVSHSSVGADFRVIFAEPPLGLTLTKNFSGSAEVTKLVPNGQAQQFGIAIGDVLVGVGSQWVRGYDDAMLLLSDKQYPKGLVFRRGLKHTISQTSASVIRGTKIAATQIMNTLGIKKEGSLLRSAAQRKLSNKHSMARRESPPKDNIKRGEEIRRIKTTKNELNQEPENDEFDVIFDEGEIGARIEVREGLHPISIVTSITDKSQAMLKGVTSGCIVIGINYEKFISHAHTISSLKHAKRPVIVRFKRPTK